MGPHDIQIDLEDRCRIKAMQEQGVTITGIARHLGRDRGTIQRELSRNGNTAGIIHFRCTKHRQ